MTTLRARPDRLKLSDGKLLIARKDGTVDLAGPTGIPFGLFTKPDFKKIGEFFTQISMPDLTGDPIQDDLLMEEWRNSE